MNIEPWDSPKRTKRLDYKTRQEIPEEEWRKYVWLDVTSMSDPEDAHVYAKTLIRKEII